MTIQYSQPSRNLFLQRGLVGTLLQTTSYGTAVNRAITLYSGAQPAADTIVSSWSSYNASYLIHWQNIPLINPYPDATVPYITNNTLPSAVAATNSGTATWAIVWAGNPATGTAAGQIGNATIPTTSFIIVPVSDVFGTGIIKLTTTTIVAASSYMFLDFTMKVGGL